MIFSFNLLLIFGLVFVIKSEPAHNISVSPPVLWQNLSNFVQFWSKDFRDKNKPIIEELLKSSQKISTNCRISLLSTLDGVSKVNDWAIQMINSWGHFPASGLFEGSLTDFGSYDQCLSINDNQIIGSAQYCSVSFVPTLPRPMARQHNLYHQIGNLLPPEVYTNRTNALIRIANESSIFYWVSLRTAVCTPNKCSQNDIKSLAKTENSRGFIFVRLFSLSKTMSRLMAPNSSRDLSCIHGIRVLSILWIIYGHTILWSNYQLYSRSFSGKELLTAFLAQPFLSAEYGIATFLLISGFLTTYISFSMTKFNVKNFQISVYILVRVIRLVPQLMIFILLTFLMPLFGSGPIWDEVVGKNVRNCANNWWLNLFLIQNLYKSDQMCALHTWFIALDFQFHLISALLIVVFLYNLKYGVVLNIISILVFLVISTVMVYVYELPPALINTGRTEYFEQYFGYVFHKKPISYGAVYFTGTLMGYFLYRKRTKNIRPALRHILWTVIIMGFCLPLWDKVYWNYGRPYTPLLSTFLYNSNQMIWTVCTSTMIWLCVTGNGGVVNRLLSHKAFIPLSRLTYCVYLCHAWLIWYYMGSRRHLIDVSMYNVLVNFIHICVMSYIFGFVFYILFESPILESQKCFLEAMLKRSAKIDIYDNEVEVKLKTIVKIVP